MSECKDRSESEMDERKIVVVVEDVDAARTALQWALHNLLRYGDLLTLLHVFPYHPSSRSKKKLRLQRLKGYQLALSFKEIVSDNFFNTRIEIVVTEDNEDGGRIVELVKEIGAFTLVVGLHDESFLYALSMTHNNIASIFNCKVLAIKPPQSSRLVVDINRNIKLPQGPRESFETSSPSSSNMRFEFSLIEIANLCVPEVSPPKIPYQICPSPYAILWRCKKTRWKGRART